MEPYEISNLTEEALDALERGDYVRAIAVTDQLIEAAADDPVVCLIRAEALIKNDSGEEAYEEARRAAELLPTHVHAQVLLGLAAWRSGRLGVAQEALQRAIGLPGRKRALLIDYAWFMASERGPRLAEEAARDAVEANPDASTAWAALGLAQFRLHRFADAEASLKRALELDPNDPYAQAAMAELLHDRRRDSKALALARLLEDTPGTEPVIETIREEARQRQIARKLVERNAYPAPYRATISSIWLWLFLTGLLIGSAMLLFQPRSVPAVALCIAIPLLLVWIWRKLMP